VSPSDPAGAAAEADALVGKDPQGAQRAAVAALAAARAAGDTRAAAAAHRAHGRAAYELGRPDEAVASLRQSVRAATRAGDLTSAARARSSWPSRGAPRSHCASSTARHRRCAACTPGSCSCSAG
jgi:hypothetical protein